MFSADGCDTIRWEPATATATTTTTSSSSSSGVGKHKALLSSSASSSSSSSSSSRGWLHYLGYQHRGHLTDLSILTVLSATQADPYARQRGSVSEPALTTLSTTTNNNRGSIPSDDSNNNSNNNNNNNHNNPPAEQISSLNPFPYPSPNPSPSPSPSSDPSPSPSPCADAVATHSALTMLGTRALRTSGDKHSPARTFSVYVPTLLCSVYTSL